MSALKLEGIIKTFPNGAQACRSIDFDVKPGEIHALIGENGAGKSTLMRIAFGLEQPDAGSIVRSGEVRQYSGAQQAMADGLGMVHQAFQQVSTFTVAENVVLGAEPVRRGGRIDTQAAISATAELAETYGLDIDPTAIVGDLPVGLRQRVEILQALYRGAQILILDEPTAVLTPSETDDLFDALRDLVAGGRSIVLITHKLREVLAIADRITVLRDGAVVGNTTADQATEADLAAMMVGRPAVPPRRSPAQSTGKPILVIKDLNVNRDDGVRAIRDLSLGVMSGEIFGIAGVEGNGQGELAETLSGIRPASSGSIKIDGVAINELSTLEIRRIGVGFIPEDRRRTGLALSETIADNLILNNHFSEQPTRFGLLDYGAIHVRSQELIDEFGIRTSGPENTAGSLSGGNAQKVVAAREMEHSPALLIASQPTRGVDIGAIEFLHDRLLAERDKGMAVLLISADLREILHLSDRVGVIFEGRFTAVFDDVGSLTESQVGEFMLGTGSQEVDRS